MDPRLEAFLEELESLAERLHGLRVTRPDRFHPDRVYLHFSESFPMWMVIELRENDDQAFFYGVVRTYGHPGDRSDYHDLISSIWALCLRAFNVASSRMVDIPHPVVEGEMYGRLVYFDKQPAASILSISHPNFQLLEEILWASHLCVGFISHVFAASGGNHSTEEYRGEEGADWAALVSRTLRLKADHRSANYSRRYCPDWSYFHRDDLGISAFYLKPNLLPILPQSLVEDAAIVARGADGVFVQTGGIRNFILYEDLDTISKLARVFNVQVELPDNSLLDRDCALIIPIESHLFCVTARGIISLARECGYRQYVAQHAIAMKQVQSLSSILHSSVRFSWSATIDDERFEQLVLEIVGREEGVQWVRKVGHSLASDAERDLLADWYLGPAPGQNSSFDESPFQKRRVIIQCKAYRDAVNLKRIPDVPKILDLHNATGFLLVAFPRVTPQVVDYFNTVPARRGFWADWWTLAEIEERLRRNLDIVDRYPDLLTVVETSRPK